MTLNPRSVRTRITQRRQMLMDDRSSYDGLAKDIARYLLPRSARFDDSDRNKTSSTDFASIIDETGTQAHSTLEAGLMAGMTSPARPWVKLATADRGLMEYAPVKVWLSRTADRMLQIFAKSNTYRAFRSMYGQLGAYGVAANVIVDNYQTVVHNYPQVFGRYVIALDQYGKPDTLCRDMVKTVAQLVGEFGIDACSMTVRTMYERGQFDTPIPCIHIIEPRRNREYDKRDAKNMPFSSCYIETGADDPNKVLRESGFREFPALCPRWLSEGDDTYASRWPAMVALGSVKQLHQEQLQKSRAIDYQVQPPLQAAIAYKDAQLDLLPGGLSFVDMTNPQGGIKTAFDVRLDLSHLLGDIQDVRQRINTSFFVDLFRMLINDDRSGITAREVAERHEEKLLMLGPVLESLHTEMLQPAIEITLAKMMRAGLFRPGTDLEPPPEMHNQDLDIEFISTLAQAQRAVGTGAIDRYVGTIASLSNIKPGILDKLDEDQVADVYADALGIDPSLVVADDKVALIRKQRASAQAVQQAAAMAPAAKDMATAGKTASETDAGQLSNVMSAFQGYGIPGMSGSQ